MATGACGCHVGALVLYEDTARARMAESACGIGNAREERLQSEYGLTLARIHLTHYLVCRTEC